MKTIAELLEQTRPVTKGSRVRGKSAKCRGHKASSIKTNSKPGSGGGHASATGMSAQAMQVEYQREALSYLRQQESMQKCDRENALSRMSGLFGVGQAAAVR